MSKHRSAPRFSPWASRWFAPAAASAHPLGNFSVNHLARVSVSADRVDVRYILDEAEIPTFQQRDVPDATLLARKRAEVERRLVLTVDGRRVALRPAGRATITHPQGQGGLRTTRVELPLTARVDDPRRVELRDDTFAGRVGWKAIVAAPGKRHRRCARTCPRATPPTGCARTPRTCSRARRTCAPPASTRGPAPER